MAANPGARPRDDDMLRRLLDDQRLQRVRRRGHTETKTFIVGGEISTPLYVPPFCVGVDTDEDTPEFKRIVAFRAVLRIGTCTITWTINGATLHAGHDVTAAFGEFDVTLADIDPYPVEDGQWIRPTFTAASGAFDLAAAVVFATSPR